VTAVDTSGGPCDAWPAVFCCDLTGTSPAVTGNAVTMATQALYAACGERFGTCAVTLRPCRDDCAGYAGGWGDSWAYGSSAGGSWVQPALIQGRWYNLTCGSCDGSCSCAMVDSIRLPGPVVEVTQVKIDGVVLAPSGYRLVDYRKLIRVNTLWPICQNLNLDDSQPGTWSVTATFGVPVPLLAQQACGELACEIIKACAGVDCRLPANIASLARQGVNITFNLDRHVVENLFFGQLFLKTYNPHGLTSRARMYDLDGPGFTRDT
jgi:hypothetical protein